MENKSWEEQLKDMLGDPSSGKFSDALDPTTPENQLNEPLQSQGWKRIEASLEATENAFDETVKQKVGNYETRFDPHAWPVFLQHFTERKYLRTKLALLKTIEAAALLLLLLTAINLGMLNDPDVRDQTEKHLFTEKTSSDQRTHQDISSAELTNSHQPASNNQTAANGLKKDNPKSSQSVQPHSTNQNLHDSKIHAAPAGQLSQPSTFGSAKDVVSTETHNGVKSTGATENTSARITDAIDALPADLHALHHARSQDIPNVTIHDQRLTASIDGLDPFVSHQYAASVPLPKYVKPRQGKYAEFAILSQADYNGLRMPEDRLFTSGQQIVFPEKGIRSHGFGGGFTVAIAHPVWALEAGVIYSAKDFKPGRQLIVGGVFDNGSVEFEAMRLQMVSVPIQYRYRFDRKGRMKMYGMGGMGFNVIAQSDTDVKIEYNFPSLSFGENPASHPQLAETIAETRRISEHIQDGAPFSTKSFVSLHAGLGAEYAMAANKTLFLQTNFSYQIPNITFSNNNGKHLRSVSLQAGVRTPLGR